MTDQQPHETVICLSRESNRVQRLKFLPEPHSKHFFTAITVVVLLCSICHALPLHHRIPHEIITLAKIFVNWSFHYSFYCQATKSLGYLQANLSVRTALINLSKLQIGTCSITMHRANRCVVLITLPLPSIGSPESTTHKTLCSCFNLNVTVHCCCCFLSCLDMFVCLFWFLPPAKL